MRTVFRLAECQVVGGMASLEGAAPFAQAALVLGRGADRLQVHRYLGEDEAEGAALTADEFADLQSSGDALALARPATPRSGAVLIVLRHTLATDGRERQVLHHDGAAHIEQRGAARAYIVLREAAVDLRAGWGHQSYNDAWAAARQGRWDESLRHAEACFVLRGLTDSAVALWAAILEASGDKDQCESLLHLARRSRGAAVHEQALEQLARLRAELAAPPQYGREPSLRRTVARIHAAAVAKSMQRLRLAKAC